MNIKSLLHLLFGIALLICFAGAALSQFQHGHLLLSFCCGFTGILYVSQAVRRFLASVRSR